MNWLTRIHDRKTPPGLELRILRSLPRVTLLGALVILAMPVVARFWPAQPGIETVKHVLSVDIFAIAAGITLLTAVFTVAIGCVIVHIMKGPAYVADALPVSHADRPETGGAASRSGVDARRKEVGPGRVGDPHD